MAYVGSLKLMGRYYYICLCFSILLLAFLFAHCIAMPPQKIDNQIVIKTIVSRKKITSLEIVRTCFITWDSKICRLCKIGYPSTSLRLSFWREALTWRHPNANTRIRWPHKYISINTNLYKRTTKRKFTLFL